MMRRLFHRLTKRQWSPGLILRAVVSLCLFAYFLVLTNLVAALLKLLPRFMDESESDRISHDVTRRLAFHFIQLNPGWRCRFRGLENIDPARTYVFVANHQSMVDIGLLSRLEATYKWIAKIQVFRMPGVGDLLRLNRYLAVSHHSVKSVRRMMKDGKKYLTEGMSLFIFPEGRRSLDGQLCEFKQGPFRLACETDTLVLPVAIEGTRKVLPTGEWIFDFFADLTVSVLPPLSASDYDNDPSLLCGAAKQAIGNELSRIRGDFSAPDVVSPSLVVSANDIQ